MKKKIFIIASALYIASFNALAYTLSYSYNDSAMTASVTDCSDGAEEEDVIIPSKVSRRVNTGKKDDDGDYIYVTKTYAVTSIGYAAFKGCNNLTSITIPDSVTSIDDSAFFRCSNLEKVDGLDKLTSIPSSLFYECSNLTTIDIDFSKIISIGSSAFYGCDKLNFSEDGVLNLPNIESIGNNAYSGCYGLKKVITGEKLVTLKDGAFSYCLGLVEAEINGTNLYISFGVFRLCSNLNVLKFGDGVVSISVPSYNLASYSYMFDGCSNLQYVHFGDGITSVPEDLFYKCSSLKSVTGFSNLKSIGEKAFYGCSNLEKVDGLDKLTSIPWSLFYKCSNLTTIDIDFPKIISIGSSAFYGCNKLNFSEDGVLNLPNIESISDSAFYGCYGLKKVITGEKLVTLDRRVFSYSGLKSVTIPDSVTSIGDNAFDGCSGLKSVTIPNSVTSIGNYVFDGCYGLTNVTIGNNVTSIGSGAFEGCSGLTNVTIPDGVTSIRYRAFWRCSGLTSVTIPDSVTSIGDSAFYGCNRLTSITIPNSVTSIGDHAFGGCSSRYRYDVYFMGIPPEVGFQAFFSIGTTGRGHYPKGYQSSWLPKIDNGKWNGLIMHELSQPILEIESIDFDNDGVTFSWDDSLASGEVNPSPLSYTYSIYMGTSSDKTAAKKIVSGIRGNTWTTNEFYSIKPVLSPLYFWVEAEGDDFNIPISNCLETRNRHGLAFGFTGDKTLGDAFSNDANLFSKMAEAKGNFMIRIGCDCPEDEMRREIWKYAENIVKPGDIFCFFISNHGLDGFLFVEDNISGYTESELREDINKFSDKNVAVISIIMACHSDGMVKGKRKNEAFVVSCLEDQYSVVLKDQYSYFSWYMSVAGWERSYADARLIGFEDQNGNEDGNITFYELANYTKQLYKGGDIAEKKTFWFNTPYNESCLSDVQIHGERLRKNIVVAENAYFKKLNKPKLPYLFALSHNGDKTMGIQFRQVEGAQQYRIYRGVDNGKMELYWPFVRTTETQQKLEDVSGNDINTKIGKTYSYYIRSLNEMAMSDPSKILSAFCGKMSIEYVLTHASHLIGASAEPTSEQLEEAYNTKTVNGYTYGECFVAGLDPKDPNAKFIAKIDMIDGLPNVSWEPDLGDERKYIVEGKENLDDENWLPANDTHKFFRVRVSLPDEMQEDDDSGSSDKIVTVFFEPRDGIVSIDNITYHSGTVVGELPTPTLEGHTFMGWYDNIIDGNKYTSVSDVPDEDIVLYAIWEPETYIVKFNANGGTGEMFDQAFTYDVEQTLAVNTFSREGYIFAGWATSPDGDVVYELDESITLTSSQTLYAVWTVNTY